MTMHMNELEDHFKLYYDTLDKMRQEVLKNEYETNLVFKTFESRLRKLLSEVQSKNVIEFFYERSSIDY